MVDYLSFELLKNELEKVQNKYITSKKNLVKINLNYSQFYLFRQ